MPECRGENGWKGIIRNTNSPNQRAWFGINVVCQCRPFVNFHHRGCSRVAFFIRPKWEAFPAIYRVLRMGNSNINFLISLWNFPTPAENFSLNFYPNHHLVVRKSNFPSVRLSQILHTFFTALNTQSPSGTECEICLLVCALLERTLDNPFRFCFVRFPLPCTTTQI